MGPPYEFLIENWMNLNPVLLKAYPRIVYNYDAVSIYSKEKIFVKQIDFSLINEKISYNVIPFMTVGHEGDFFRPRPGRA